ncbi:MAG: L,D-transpeptidase [Polyangiaceae bacterium]
MLLTALAATGCSDNEAETAPAAAVAVEDVPVPPADGPKLLVTRHRTPVRERPEPSATILGELALGAQVARSPEPISKSDCPAGWYAVRPRGFVCAEGTATVDLAHPAAKSLQPPADRAMPYRYARVARGAAVSYAALPTPAEQAEAEPKGSPRAEEVEKLGLASNDVPLDGDGLPTGVAVLTPEGDGVGDDGYRTTASWFATLPTTPLAAGATVATGHGEQTRVLKRRSGLALTGATRVDDRLFGITSDGRFIPVDRLEPDLGSIWHGERLDQVELPVGFALRSGVGAYHIEKGNVERLDEDYEQHEAIPINGKFRTIGGVRYYFTKSEHWVRHKDIILLFGRRQFPDWATPEQKWIDVSLANQTLIAWEGHKALFATLISSGADRLGDPQTGPSTMQGVFRLRNKHITRDVDDREVGQAYSLGEAPWVLDFAEGFALAGCYWHERFGEARSFHDVALSPIDAHWLWAWAAPEVPEGWHSVAIPEDAEDNTIVYIHK